MKTNRFKFIQFNYYLYFSFEANGAKARMTIIIQ